MGDRPYIGGKPARCPACDGAVLPGSLRESRDVDDPTIIVGSIVCTVCEQERLYLRRENRDDRQPSLFEAAP